MTDKQANELLKTLTPEQKIAILKGKIERNEISLDINYNKQSRHINPIDDRSYLTIDINKMQSIINDKHSTGMIYISNNGKQIKEVIDCGEKIGVNANKSDTNIRTATSFATIHYSNTGTHLVPARGK